MIAEHLISNTIIPLRTSDTGDEALGIMGDFYVRHLPIVNQKELLGLISETEILNHDTSQAVGSYELSLQHPFVQINDHLFDVMKLVGEHQLSVIPVVDAQNQYIGLILAEELIQHFAKTGGFHESGSIIVLEMLRQDYALSQIAGIVESENAVILNSHVQTFTNSPQIELTLKINKHNILNIIASFERFDYHVKATFNELEYKDTLQERYEGLISYLNV